MNGFEPLYISENRLKTEICNIFNILCYYPLFVHHKGLLNLLSYMTNNTYAMFNTHFIPFKELHRYSINSGE